MAATRPAFWQRRTGTALLLWPLSVLFGAATAGRRLCYRIGLCRTQPSPVPVIVVGNIAVGGSGKTPVVVWLVEALRAQGWSPGIVSRGYGRTDDRIRLVQASDTPEFVGDEPQLLSQLTHAPVVVGANRPEAIRQLVASCREVNVVISDDGMQHLPMERVAEVVVLDEQVLGNRWLLPAGPLRETVSRLAAASVLIVHGPVSDALARMLPPVPTARMTLEGAEFRAIADPSVARSAADFSGRRVHAVAGIGRPERFFDQLRSLGLEVVPHPFPDHHRFAPEDLVFADAAPILMTEKDAVKCAAFAPADTWVFPVRARISEAALQPILDSLDRHGRQAA